jgi:uncharacterized protein YacL
MEKEALQDKQKPEEGKKIPTFSANLIGQIADEVSKTLMTRLPGMLPSKRVKKSVKKQKKIDNAFFFDTSAIIDGRIFEVISLGLLNGIVVLLPSILLELKHLADTQNTVKRERGRKGLELLEQLRKKKQMRVIVITDEEEKRFKGEVDEKLIKAAKAYKGKIVTCDYNLEKKAQVENVMVINMNALANVLKVIAVPGDSVHILLIHKGKDPTQGVGYLDDGTMIVVEFGSDFVGKTVDVVVSRVIQRASGKILFAKKI